MIRLEELEAAKKEVGKVTGEKPISQKMFKAINIEEIRTMTSVAMCCRGCFLCRKNTGVML